MPTTDINPPAFDAALVLLGIPQTEENREHLAVLREAMLVHVDREEKYRGLWKEAGYCDSADHIRSKALRVSHAAGPHDHDRAVDVLDDALDLVNYSVFYVRNVRAGRVVQV